MAISNVVPRAYALRHPEHDVPTSAAFVDYWRSNGRNEGLVLQFPGEAHTRHLTYKEVERLQQEDEGSHQEVTCT